MSLTTQPLLPLTTVFTPPAACLATATYNENAIWAPSYSKSLSPAVLYGATGQAPDLVCYPPRYTVSHLYSPGICPSGWASACEIQDYSGKPMLPTPTVGVQCCPHNFRCSDADWCVQDPTPTMVQLWSIYTDKWGLEGHMTSSAFPNDKAFAKPIFVAHQATDEALLSSLSASAARATSSADSSSGSSLSGGTIAGIVIGSAAGGILAAVLFFASLWFCLGFRFTRSRQGGSLQSESHHELSGKDAVLAHPSSQQKSSILPQWSATELPSARAQGPDPTTFELDTSATHGRTELADSGHREYKT